MPRGALPRRDGAGKAIDYSTLLLLREPVCQETPQDGLPPGQRVPHGDSSRSTRTRSCTDDETAPPIGERQSHRVPPRRFRARRRQEQEEEGDRSGDAASCFEIETFVSFFFFVAEFDSVRCWVLLDDKSFVRSHIVHQPVLLGRTRAYRKGPPLPPDVAPSKCWSTPPTRVLRLGHRDSTDPFFQVVVVPTDPLAVVDAARVSTGVGRRGRRRRRWGSRRSGVYAPVPSWVGIRAESDGQSRSAKSDAERDELRRAGRPGDGRRGGRRRW